MFHASIRHHPPQRSTLRLNSVAPLRGNGIHVPADAPGCNLNPTSELDNNASCSIRLISVFRTARVLSSTGADVALAGEVRGSDADELRQPLTPPLPQTRAPAKQKVVQDS